MAIQLRIMNTIDEYAKFVVMAEDAIQTQNTSKMKWLGLEHTRQTIQREMIHLEYFIQSSKHNPLCETLRDNYKRSIESNLKEMKDVIVELRLEHVLSQLVDSLKTMDGFDMVMGDAYIPFCSGHLMELPMNLKKEIYDKLCIFKLEKV